MFVDYAGEYLRAFAGIGNAFKMVGNGEKLFNLLEVLRANFLERWTERYVSIPENGKSFQHVSFDAQFFPSTQERESN